MQYIIKGLIAIYIVLVFLVTKEIEAIELVLFLALMAVSVFIDSNMKKAAVVIILLECAVVFLTGVYTHYVVFALMILLFDILYTDKYLFGIIFAAQFIYFDCYNEEYETYLVLTVVACVAYIIKANLKKQEKHLAALDGERKTKYELEVTKASLIKSSIELQRLTQVKERNRIARDLHDTIGHKIAGILIKLQATKKVMESDTKKGNALLDECISHLQGSLQIVRDTVHDMYSHDTQGIDYIKSITDEYKYCNVDFKAEGIFIDCPQRHIVILSYVLKEALTNTAKYSKATKVDVLLECIDNVLVMKIKDNGIGCEDIKESLGIKSMRDRIKSIGGTFVVDGCDGMALKCIIPI